MSKLKIYTAVDSILYSPVFLAVLNDDRLRKNVELVSVSAKPMTVDDWLHNVIYTDDWAVAIGDPMRLTAFSNPRKVDFLGILIDKMCFWIIDHDVDLEWFHIDKFVVHPRGMTAFSVTAHQLAERWELDTLSEDRNERERAISELNMRLRDRDVNPNRESEVYFNIRKEIEERGTSDEGVRHAAFVTANPFYGNDLGGGLRRIYSFMTDYPQAIMTTLIGRANPHHDEKELRERLVRGVVDSCAKIQHAPIHCASILWRNWRKIYPQQERPAGFKQLSEFASALDSLAHLRIYNSDRKLFVDKPYLDKTCEIRRRIEPLLSDEQRMSSVEAVSERLKECVYDA